MTTPLEPMIQYERDVLRVAKVMRERENGICWFHYEGQQETTWSEQMRSQVILSTSYQIREIDETNRQLTVRCTQRDRNYEEVTLPFNKVTGISQIVVP